MSLRLLKPEKATGTNVDTIEVTPDIIKGWKIPPFQRPVRENEKVLALAQELTTNGGVFPGMLTIGILDNKKWLVDGQHRCHSFILSELEVGYSDVRFRTYKSMAEMADDFVDLNGRLVNMKPDDIMRGLESSVPAIASIRERCSYVGYDQIRRGQNAPILSMSALIRCWVAASKDAPGSVSISATELSKVLTTDDADQVVSFLGLAYRAFGRDPEYFRLWGNLNLTLCMWVFRRAVLAKYSAKAPKITKELFGKMLQSLSADSGYVDYLLGRQMGERDRSPCYRRMKAVFVKRLEAELGHKVSFPAPDWLT